MIYVIEYNVVCSFYPETSSFSHGKVELVVEDFKGRVRRKVNAIETCVRSAGAKRNPEVNYLLSLKG